MGTYVRMYVCTVPIHVYWGIARSHAAMSMQTHTIKIQVQKRACGTVRMSTIEHGTGGQQRMN